MSHFPTSHRELLDLWPKRSVIAAEVGASHDAVRAWASRNVIPRSYWPLLVDLASRDKIAGVTEEAIGRMSQGPMPDYVAADFE